MKRDLVLLSLCMCVLVGVSWLGCDHMVAAVSVPIKNDFVLILDAGHGGEDGGASSASGNRESDINLEIVLKLESLMAFLGVDTTLTRAEDVSIHSEGAATLREKGFRPEKPGCYRRKLLKCDANEYTPKSLYRFEVQRSTSVL